MDIKKNKIIKFNNGDYLVLDVIHHKGNTYLYLINNKEFEDDVSIVKVENNNGIIKYNYIEDEEEFDYIINKLFLENINDINDYFEG
jgi:hypothetical protein